MVFVWLIDVWEKTDGSPTIFCIDFIETELQNAHARDTRFHNDLHIRRLFVAKEVKTRGT